MKKLNLFLASLLCVAMAFSVLACGNTVDPVTPDNNAGAGNNIGDEGNQNTGDNQNTGNDGSENTGDNQNTNGDGSENTNATQNTAGERDVTFDLDDAKGFFIGTAGEATRSAARAAADSKILMKINSKGETVPAVTLSDNVNFNLEKILKNPVTGELYLKGSFDKCANGSEIWVEDYDSNGNVIGSHTEWQGDDDSWSYNLIRVAQDGNWYGLKDISNISIPEDPFDSEGNLYFSASKWDGNEFVENIYRYSGNTATPIVNIDNGSLKKVLSNGAVVYVVNRTGTYVLLASGTKICLYNGDSWWNNRGMAYVPAKNVLYYDLSYEARDSTSSKKDSIGYVYPNKIPVTASSDFKYVAADGTSYNTYDCCHDKHYVYKKVTVELGDDAYWYDDNLNKYEEKDGSYRQDYIAKNTKLLKWCTIDGKDIYKDIDGNEYDKYDGDKFFYYVFAGEKTKVTQDGDFWVDVYGNKYLYPDEYDNENCYVYKDKIEVKPKGDFFEDANGERYTKCDVNHNCAYICDKVLVKEHFEDNKTFYYDADGKRYDSCDGWYDVNYIITGTIPVLWNHIKEWYEDADGNWYNTSDFSEYVYYVFAGDKVWVEYKEPFYYDADGNRYQEPDSVEITVTSKYLDFDDNKLKSASYVDIVPQQSNNGGTVNASSILETASANVTESSFVSDSLHQFEIQNNLSLKITYLLPEKGLVTYGWDSNKILEEGKKIYFLGEEESNNSNTSTKKVRRLYKIIKFGEPVPLEGSELYAFNHGVSFAKNGEFIASVERWSDGVSGTLQGNMETGTFTFTDRGTEFKSVTDIIINF